MKSSPILVEICVLMKTRKIGISSFQNLRYIEMLDGENDEGNLVLYPYSRKTYHLTLLIEKVLPWIHHESQF